MAHASLDQLAPTPTLGTHSVFLHEEVGRELHPREHVSNQVGVCSLLYIRGVPSLEHRQFVS